MKKILLLICLFHTALAGAHTLPFLYLPADPAALSGDASPAASVADNRAALAALTPARWSAGVSCLLWNGDDRLLSAAGHWRQDRWGVHLSLRYFRQESFEEYDAWAAPTGRFTPEDLSVGLGASYRLTDHLAAAVTARYISSSLASTASDRTFGTDVGVAYDGGLIRASLACCNIGPSVNYAGSDCRQPMLLKGGAEVRKGAFSAGAEGSYVFDAGPMAGVGAQYLIANTAAVRAAYHWGDATETLPSYATAGLGLYLGGWRLDLSCLFGSKTLDDTMQAGVSFAF